MNISVFLAWLPGHSGIEFHDLADGLAKDTALGVTSGRVPATNTITYVDAVKISKDIALKSWQTKWNWELAGSYTRQLIPEVGVKIHFPEERDIGISYCRLLLHDTMLMDDELVCRTLQSVNADLTEKLQITFLLFAADMKKQESS